jgi:hypothetical protein
MDEALIIKPGFATPDIGKQKTKQMRADQTSLPSLPLFQTQS